MNKRSAILVVLACVMFVSYSVHVEAANTSGGGFPWEEVTNASK
ncbi:hypothetical protein [Paenibacillus assamensis]|nr:hypothetical protein [Paenibacillus assamensis]